MVEVRSGFIGPIRRGDTRAPAPFQGPVRPGTDVKEFRRTGRSKSKGGGGSSSKQVGPTRATLDAEKKRQVSIEKAAQQKETDRRETIRSRTIGGQVGSGDPG